MTPTSLLSSGDFHPFSKFRRRVHTTLYPLFPLLLLTGCATTPQQVAWATICSRAPHRPGQAIGQDEQRAMDVVDGWALSVEELDARCQTK